MRKTSPRGDLDEQVPVEQGTPTSSEREHSGATVNEENELLTDAHADSGAEPFTDEGAGDEEDGAEYPSPRSVDTFERDEQHYDVEIELQFPMSGDLLMWPGVRKGYVRKLVMEENGVKRAFYMKTLSLDPPIFGAPGY